MTDKTFNLKGLSFNKEDLDIITLDDLGEKQIAPGHVIFLSAKFNKPVILLRAGDFVDPAFVKKYKEKGQKSFYMLNVVHQDNIDDYNSLWIKLKVGRFEQERLEARKELLEKFSEQLWFDDEEVCSLDFLISCFDTFNRLADEIMIEMRETSTLLCERGLQSASFATITALALGYTDYEVLSDIFHVTFLLDFGLIGDKYSYFIAQACEQERKTPGGGMKYLEKMNAPKKEKDLFYNHPVLGHQEVFRRCYGAFYNMELMKLISLHHEKHDGSGFPGKINYWGISELEAIPLFMDYIVPFDEFMYTSTGGGGLLKSYVDQAEDDGVIDILPLRKVHDHLIEAMAFSLEETIDKKTKDEDEDATASERLELNEATEGEFKVDEEEVQNESILEKFGT
jgi:hypothetical protein